MCSYGWGFLWRIKKTDIQFTYNNGHHFKVYNSGDFSIFTRFQPSPLTKIPECFITRKRNHMPISSQCHSPQLRHWKWIIYFLSLRDLFIHIYTHLHTKLKTIGKSNWTLLNPAQTQNYRSVRVWQEALPHLSWSKSAGLLMWPLKYAPVLLPVLPRLPSPLSVSQLTAWSDQWQWEAQNPKAYGVIEYIC